MSDRRHPARSAMTAGEGMGRRVLGDEYVDAARGGADGFTRVLDDFLTEHCWGTAWTREQLYPRSRSIVTLPGLAALGRSQEIATHTRGAHRNGLSAVEIAELFLHVGVYAGVPSAVEAFRAARPVIDKSDEATGPSGL